jgi:hypothetical protein
MYYFSIYLISVDMNLAKASITIYISNSPSKAGIIDKEKWAV